MLSEDFALTPSYSSPFEGHGCSPWTEPDADNEASHGGAGINPLDSASGSELTLSASFNQEKPRTQRTLAPNLTRRSHRKSRGGCFSCKGRKIKCGEEKPACKNCAVKEIDCNYPLQQTIRPSTVIARRAPELHQSRSLSSQASTTFTLTDMRFFHHFLTVAYPHLPAGNESVWVEEIPKFAEDRQYLMHAILALGASHLNRLDPKTEYESKAMVHRGHALAGLNHALSKKGLDPGDGDSMLAACYALTFQASYMDDGLADFITMVRGCSLVQGKLVDEGAAIAFNLRPDAHITTLEPGISQLPLIDRELVDAGANAIESLVPFLKAQADKDFHAALRKVLLALLRSTRDGYIDFTSCYSVWYQLCAESFVAFVDPKNMTAQLLLGYFIAIQLMMAPITQPIYQWPRRNAGTNAGVLNGIIAWAERIFLTVPDEFQVYLVWPKHIIATVREEIANPESEIRILRMANGYESP